MRSGRGQSRLPCYGSATARRRPSVDFGMLLVNGGLETKKLEAAPGFEPGNKGFADPRLTTWLCRHPLLLLHFRLALGRGVTTSVTSRPVYPRCLRTDRRGVQSTIALRGDNRGVPEHLLKGRQATTRFEPAASERVPQLMDMEPRHAAQNAHACVKLPGA